MSKSHVSRSVNGVVAAVMCGLSVTSCADLARTGTGPAYLIVLSVTAASNGGAVFAASLQSDVLTIVAGTTSRLVDFGQASIRAEMKNPLTTTAPSALNSITINRYRVRFRRTDGQSREGVDVPYGFDGATTMNIPVGQVAQVRFDLVRPQSKSEPPLSTLISGGGLRVISVIAEVTFYGSDQAGNDVSVSGTIDVQFSDF